MDLRNRTSCKQAVIGSIDKKRHTLMSNSNNGVYCLNDAEIKAGSDIELEKCIFVPKKIKAPSTTSIHIS